MDAVKELSFEELSVLCSNLAKACSKQFRLEEAGLFTQLSGYYKNQSKKTEGKQFKDISALILKEINSGYAKATHEATIAEDRGALRAIVWGEKVAKLLTSLLNRYEKQKDALLENTNVYVCEICGFIFVGDHAPEVCPICKVPNFKINKVQRGVM